MIRVLALQVDWQAVVDPWNEFTRDNPAWRLFVLLAVLLVLFIGLYIGKSFRLWRSDVEARRGQRWLFRNRD